MENFNKFKRNIRCVAIVLFFVLFLVGNVYSDNTNITVKNDDNAVEINECNKTMSEFLQIENPTSVDENYKKAEQSLNNTINNCKNDSFLFKILGVIMGIALGLVLTKKWIDRIKYEHIYKVPNFMWILKIGGIIIAIGIILIVIISIIIGIGTYIINILF